MVSGYRAITSDMGGVKEGGAFVMLRHFGCHVTTGVRCELCSAKNALVMDLTCDTSGCCHQVSLLRLL